VLKDIGAAIASERSRQGLQTNDLGIDSRVVEDIEAGRRGITTTQLEAVATTLQLDPIALRSGRVVTRPRPSVFLRHRGTQDFDAEDMPALDRALEHARVRNALVRLLGASPGLYSQGELVPRGPASDAPHAPAHQGYQLARELRRKLGNEADPIADLRILAEAVVGVTVVVRTLSTIGSSAFAVKAGDAAAIVLAPSWPLREPHARVSIAHELCHVLFDADEGAVNVIVDFEFDHRAHQAEKRARAFAAELLLPEAGLRRVLGAPGQVSGEAASTTLVAKAREAFGSTWQVTANHLCNLRYVRSDLRPWLEAQQPVPLAQAWETRLPREGGPSLQVEDLARRAYDAGHLTDGEVRAILDLDRLSPLPWNR
jgi:Zn-dependent peptidase ImmA (M78 family)